MPTAEIHENMSDLPVVRILKNVPYRVSDKQHSILECLGCPYFVLMDIALQFMYPLVISQIVAMETYCRCRWSAHATLAIFAWMCQMTKG